MIEDSPYRPCKPNHDVPDESCSTCQLFFHGKPHQRAALERLGRHQQIPEPGWGVPKTFTLRVEMDGKVYESEFRQGGVSEAIFKATNASEPSPCKYVGDELTAKERNARGLDHVRKWVYCLHKEKPLGETVCPCRGCGINCRGYLVNDPADDDSPAAVQGDGA